MTKQQTVTVYTKDNCRQCDATKRWLKARDVTYVEADLTDPGNLEAAKALGHQAAPVVVVAYDGEPGPEVSWSGFNPFQLAEHINTERGAA